MTEYMSAAEIKHLLVIALRAIHKNAVDRLLDHPEDAGDPETGRLPYELSVEVQSEMLRQLKAMPPDDIHFVRLAELVPDVDNFAEMIPDTGLVPFGTVDEPEVTALLDHLVGLAEAEVTGDG